MKQPTHIPKRLAIPASGECPDFGTVARLALNCALLGMQVCVMCFTQEVLDRWTGYSHPALSGIMLLDVLDCNRATLSDWKKMLQAHSLDLLVLHGATNELQARRLAVRYVTALVDAAAADMVVLA